MKAASLGPTATSLVFIFAVVATVTGCDGAGLTRDRSVEPTSDAASANALSAIDIEAEGTAVDGFRRLQVFRIDDVLTAKLVDTRLDDSAADIGDEFTRLAKDADAKSIILDFESVAFFSDKPLEKLMATKAECDAQSKQLILCGLQGDVREVFKIMHFDKVFTIESSLAAALQRTKS